MAHLGADPGGADGSPHPKRKTEAFEDSIRALELGVNGMDPTDAREISELRAMSSLKMPDVIVLQTALTRNTRLATSDNAVATATRSQGLSVMAPE